MTATEKAAPIPAEGPRGADVQRLADRCAQAVYSAIGRRDITRPIKEAIVDAILADRASQEERIREDERGGFVQLPDGWLAVEMKAVEREFAKWPTGIRSSFEALLRDADRARLRGDAS